MHPLNTRTLPRRSVLKMGAAAIGLPLLNAMVPAGRAAERTLDTLNPRRMAIITRGLGVHAPYLFPEKEGREYETTRYLRVLESHRGEFTLFQGMSHLGYPNAHHTDHGLLTGVSAEFIQREGDIRNTVSLDVYAAEQIGERTRFPHLTLGGAHSYNRKGVRVPSVHNESQLFQDLFIDGTPVEVAREVRRLRNGSSILDGVREQAGDLARRLGAADRERLDSLLTSVREAEQRLQQEMAWAERPKPKVEYELQNFSEAQLVDRTRQWFDLIHLAFRTDSTRIVALNIHSHGATGVEGVQIQHHDASHHGQEPHKIEQLAKVEEAEFRQFDYLLTKLKSDRESHGTLLDRTMVLHLSNLGNASSHTPFNLPIILAGGGFKHAGHVKYNTDRAHNRPLCDLYLRMLHQLGVEADSFSTSRSTVSEIG